MSQKAVFTELLHKYVQNTISKDEFQEFFLLMNQLSAKDLDEAFQQIQGTTTTDTQDLTPSLPTGPDHEAKLNQIWNRLEQEAIASNGTPIIPLKRENRSFNYGKWTAIAAVFILVFGIGFHFYNRDTAQPEAFAQEEILPAQDESVITLPNGKEIIIKDHIDGVLFADENFKVVKNANDELKIEAVKANESISEVLQYSTVQTSTGGFSSFVLPDGSKVFLSSRSSLKFPTKFATTAREVNLTGEGYFEVEKNPKAPFRVVTENQVVEVLGTHFNVRVYPDEKEQLTTLVEGKVKVSDKRSTDPNEFVILNPGEQATFSNNNLNKRSVETDVVTGWKTNRFIYRNSHLYTVLKDIERWYGVSFTFSTTELPQQYIFGNVSRDVPLDQLLKVISSNTGLKFTTKERRIYVNP